MCALDCLCRADRSPFAFREALRAAFPGAPAKQSVLLHASLARMLLPPPGADTLDAVRAACERATALLRGREVRIGAVWHVIERSLPIDGDVTELPLGPAAAGSS